MGILDRDYYRNDGVSGRWLNPNRVCTWLIVINLAAFVVQLATRTDPRAGGIDGPFTNLFELNPNRVIQGEVWRLLTGAFLHSVAWQHILFNMLGLWFFGRQLEEMYGSKEFLGFYLAAAIVSSLAYCGQQLAQYGLGGAHSAIGASGAVSAVMVLFAMHFPTATVLLFFVIPMPVIALVILYAVVDSIGLLGGRAGEAVGFAAHLGGMLFGFLYHRFHWRVLNWWPTRMSMRPRRLSRPRLRVYREPEDTALATPGMDEDEQLEAQLDSVLAKVAKQGCGSLSEREHQILLKASEVYKQRRK